MPSSPSPTDDSKRPNRRGFFRRIGSWLMGLGLVSGYGMFAVIIGRFLYPTRNPRRMWQFVSTLADVERGQSVKYVTPIGQQVLVTRVGDEGGADDFVALSSVCPHLGCQVHWESQNDRFFCPCHNGAFDEQGRPLQGPPKDADQSLARYSLMVDDGMLFIEVDTQPLIEQRG